MRSLMTLMKKKTNPNANAVMVCDMQYGSTGKGAIVGYIARHDWQPDTVITAWAPNAGHTYIDPYGRKFVHRMLGNGIVSPNIKRVLIGPGSIVDLDVLYSEIKSCLDIVHDVDIAMHECAAIVTPEHQKIEQATMLKIGSTAKGTGAALIQKIKRDPDVRAVARDICTLPGDPEGHPVWEHVRVVDSGEYAQLVDAAERILIEGAQGYSLGINSGFYPYTTSRECVPSQVLTDCQVPMSKLMLTIGTLRTFPIRVANRFNEQGEQIGTSGPCYPDQVEASWEELGLEPEFTTVTKLRRRVFTFSTQQFMDAFRAIEPDLLFLNFMNYLTDDRARAEFKARIDGMAGRQIVRWEGHGPGDRDIVINNVPMSTEAD